MTSAGNFLNCVRNGITCRGVNARRQVPLDARAYVNRFHPHEAFTVPKHMQQWGRNASIDPERT
jgi:hypothetical protein